CRDQQSEADRITRLFRFHARQLGEIDEVGDDAYADEELDECRQGTPEQIGEESAADHGLVPLPEDSTAPPRRRLFHLAKTALPKLLALSTQVCGKRSDLF